MQSVADGVWQIEGPSLNMVAGVMIPARSTVLRLADAGEVAHVVEPSR